MSAEDVAKLKLADVPPPAPGGAGGFSFASAPVAGGAPGGNPGGFSFNLGPPAPPDDDDDDDDDDEEEEEGARLPKEVLQRVLGLKALDEKREAEMEGYLVERAALEAKYAAKLAPILADRAKIVKGELEPTLSPEDVKTADEAGTTTDDAEPLVGVPAFWLTALGRHEAFHALVVEADFACLKHLTDVRAVDDADLKGFKLEFEFGVNPFFSNAVLTKEYKIPNLADCNGQPELEGVEGCEIDWATPRDCLVRREVKKKQKSKRGKNAGATRVVSKMEEKPSFFHFFDALKLPSDEEGEEVVDDEALRERIDNDVELAFALRNQIVPRAVLWFTGEACDSDDEDEDFEYDEGEDEESD